MRGFLLLVTLLVGVSTVTSCLKHEVEGEVQLDGAVQLSADDIEEITDSIEDLYIITAEQQLVIEELEEEVERLDHLLEVHLGEAGV